MSENLRAAGKHQQMERKEDLKFGGEAMSLPADLGCLQGVGGAEGEASLATLEKQLICPICLELFNKPVVILPCQHNLCRKCANELYQPSLFQARTTMMINSGRFRCPSCRLEVVLDRHGVYGLPRNLLVENIIDVYKQEVSNYNNKVASSLPAPASSPAQGTCPDHEGEKVNIYCVTCKVPTCSLCKVFGAHQSCQVVPLSDFYQLQKDELSEEVSSLKAYNDKVRALIDDIEQTCRNIEENSETQKQRVCEQFSHMSSILDERRKAMMEKITSEQEEKTGHTQAVIRCYRDSVEANTKLMERATSSMEEPDMTAFVQASRELVKKVIAAASATLSEKPKPGYQSLSHYSFNFRRQKRALRSLDFPKTVEDVPEEQETEPDVEPKETSPQITDLKQHHEPSIQNLRSAADPDSKIIPTLTSSSPAEPVQTEAPRPVQADPGLLRVSEEPTGAVLQTETENLDLDLDNRGTDVMKNEKEEGEEEVQKRCAAPDPVKEENRSEEQDGMSTLQREGGRCAGDLIKQSQTEGDDQDEEVGGEIKEERDAELCPKICKTSCWIEMNLPPKEDDAEVKISTPQAAGDSLPESKSEPQIQAQSLDSQTLPPPGSDPSCGPISQKTKEDTEEEEEVQQRGCLPGDVDQSLNPEEERDGPGDGSLDVFPDMSYNLKDVPLEEMLFQDERMSSHLCDDTEDNNEKGGDEEEREHLEEDDKALTCASGLKERESETVKLVNDSEFKRDAGSSSEDGFKPQTGVLEVEAAEIDVCVSGFVGQKEEDAESIPSVNPQTEVKYAESLKVITLIFYLLAFLVILQRVWAYIGCFICI